MSGAAPQKTFILAELGLKSLQHIWLLRTAKFWNKLAGKPAGTMYKLIALDYCTAAVVSSRRNRAWSIFRAICGTSYELGSRPGVNPTVMIINPYGSMHDVDAIDMTALNLKQHITQQRDSIWDGLDDCPGCLF